MSRYKPTMYKKDIFSINYKKLKQDGIKCLIFDLDNTLALLNEKKCPEKTKMLIKQLQEDFIVFIISNNSKRRIEPYKKDLGVDAVSSAMKPLTIGLKRIKKKYNLLKKEMVMIGDQLVTDVISGSNFHIKTILVDPLSQTDLAITKLNRKIEAWIIKKYCKRGIFKRGDYYE